MHFHPRPRIYQDDGLASYLKDLLRQKKPDLVKTLFLSQHPDWQSQHSAILAEATASLNLPKTSDSKFHLY
ncbi:MAG: hypothetical protein AABZ60_16695 [Planctomycetota bacterium]